MEEKRISPGGLAWFYREAGEGRPVILLHGLVSQSYSWRNVIPPLARRGYRVLAPDWLGCGFSAKPQDFSYTPEALITALGTWIEAVEVQNYTLVAQGYLGSVGIQYALRNPDQVAQLVVINAPLTPGKLPWALQQFVLPLVGEMVSQDPLVVDRTLEGGGGPFTEEALNYYRRPWLKTSDVGRALLNTVRKLQLPQAGAEIQQGLAQWTKPLQLIWGTQDPWLKTTMAEALKRDLARIATGHYPQETAPDQVSKYLLDFLP